MTNKTYYEILDVSPDATEDEIKAAYRKKVQKWHPDKSDHPNADKRFKQIKTAKEVLTNSDKRDQYDNVGHETYQERNDDGAITAGSGGAPATASSPSSSPDSQSAQASTATSTPNPDATAQESNNSPGVAGYVTSSVLGQVTGNGFSIGTGSRTLFELVKKTAYSARWIVETMWQSIRAIPYGTLAFMVSLFFLAGATFDAALYIRIPSALIFLSIWAYMIMDWQLGVGGFGFTSLVLGVGHNEGFVPGGDGFKIVMTALLVALTLSFLMKLNYDFRKTSSPSVMDAIAGWDDETDETGSTN